MSVRCAINGKFLAEPMQGIVRYARELTAALDEILEADDHVELIIPPNATDIPSYEHIQVIPWGKRTGIVWEQLDFARYLHRHRDLTALNLCNVAPLVARPGVTTIHDIMYRTCPDFYTTMRNRISRLWHCLNYRILCARELAIITVSDFSRREIERCYPEARGKIHVVPNAWQHMLRVKPAEDWRERYSELEPGQYYFSLATLAKNKNGRWVYEVASRHPGLCFALAGRAYEDAGIEKPGNVHLLGYISDEDAAALITNCRAFIFPSLYEGFGVPPLEALALGAEVISSDTTSLPEVLGDAVHYIHPLDYDVDLETLISRPLTPAKETLARYSWEISASALMESLHTYVRH